MRKNLLVGGLAGLVSFAFARGGDAWGEGTAWQDAASTEVWPWLIIVAAIAATTGRLRDALTRSTLAMLLMVIAY